MGENLSICQLFPNNDKMMRRLGNKPSILKQSHLIFTTRCKFSHFFHRDLCVDFSVYFCIRLLLFIFLEQIAVCLTLYFRSELHHFNDIPKHTYTLDNCWHNANFFVITLLMENCGKVQMQSWQFFCTEHQSMHKINHICFKKYSEFSKLLKPKYGINPLHILRIKL